MLIGFHVSLLMMVHLLRRTLSFIQMSHNITDLNCKGPLERYYSCEWRGKTFVLAFNYLE